MTYEQVRCFVTLAQELNYTLAAEKLFITQPTLSRAIISLESELQLRLFERNRHRVIVTVAGQKLLPFAKKLVQDYGDLQKMGQILAQNFSATLNIGMCESGNHKILRNSIRSFERLYPQTRLNFWVGTRADGVRKVKCEELDACFACFEKTPEIDGVTVEKLPPVWFTAVVSKDCPIANIGDVLSPFLLKGNRILVSDMDVMRYSQFRMLNNGDVEYIPSQSWMLELVKSGHGVAILHGDLCAPLGKDGLKSLKVVTETCGGGYILWRPDRPKEGMKKFMEIVMEQGEQHELQ